MTISPILNRPVCGSKMRTENLQAGCSFKPYRVGLDCRSKYKTDQRTMKRTVLIAMLALTTSGLAAATFLAGFALGLVAAVSGVWLLMFMVHTPSKI